MSSNNVGNSVNQFGRNEELSYRIAEFKQRAFEILEKGMVRDTLHFSPKQLIDIEILDDSYFPVILKPTCEYFLAGIKQQTIGGVAKRGILSVHTSILKQNEQIQQGFLEREVHGLKELKNGSFPKLTMISYGNRRLKIPCIGSVLQSEIIALEGAKDRSIISSGNQEKIDNLFCAREHLYRTDFKGFTSLLKEIYQSPEDLQRMHNFKSTRF